MPSRNIAIDTITKIEGNAGLKVLIEDGADESAPEVGVRRAHDQGPRATPLLLRVARRPWRRLDPRRLRRPWRYRPHAPARFFRHQAARHGYQQRHRRGCNPCSVADRGGVLEESRLGKVP